MLDMKRLQASSQRANSIGVGQQHIIKQLLDEVEHDIMNNYQNRGLCYRLWQITQTQGFDNS